MGHAAALTSARGIRWADAYAQFPSQMGRLLVTRESYGGPFLELFQKIMWDTGPLTRQEREMIALVASRASRCKYWTEIHGEFLRFESTDPALVKQIKTDFRSAPIEPRHRALLEYAEKLTLTPYKIVDDDVDRLRRGGWSEDAIVAATHVVGIFNYLVRLADAFGIEWEPEVQASATHQPELWND
jgi:uncharacterized peroxidase-related enzyme